LEGENSSVIRQELDKVVNDSDLGSSR
jgi:hypothetical protein